MNDIVLASKSTARIRVLKDSGVKFKAAASNVDEDEIKNKCLLHKIDSKNTALELAIAKSLKLSKSYPDSLIIGADQILECDNILFNKAKNIDEAFEKLKFLRNKKHYLVNGIAVSLNNEVIWTFVNKISMVMRDFSDEFLKNYLNNNDVLGSVGCYYIEEEGIQLFSEIADDYFSILGLPIIPILDFLRDKEVILK